MSADYLYRVRRTSGAEKIRQPGAPRYVATAKGPAGRERPVKFTKTRAEAQRHANLQNIQVAVDQAVGTGNGAAIQGSVGGGAGNSAGRTITIRRVGIPDSE